MSHIKLSIIIPCYNVEAYLPHTLNSLAHLQDAEDCEFILVDDGSTDATPNLIRSFAENDRRARCIFQANQGVSAARNAALEIAVGQYVLCLDGDDFLAENAVTFIMQNIGDADALLAPNINFENNQAALTTLGLKPGAYSPSQFFEACFYVPTAPKWVYKGEIIRKYAIRFNSQLHMGEVYTFTLQFLTHCTSIQVVKQGFYYYVMRANSATHLPDFKADLTILSLLDMEDYLQQSWTNTSSYQVTLFRLIMSFTYNKYLKNKLPYSLIAPTWEIVTTTPKFISLLQRITFPLFGMCCSPFRIPLRERLMAMYVFLLPKRWGYALLRKVMDVA